MSGGLVLVACSNPAGVSNKVGVAAPQAGPTTSSDEPVVYLTVNMYMTDAGMQPASIFIPAGQKVQLVMRNLGTTEHHFRVLGLVPRDLLWLAPRGAALTAEDEAGVVRDEEHLAHHQGASFVPYRPKSPAGIRPIGDDEVHAYAAAGAMDVVLFTATNTGTFSVQCPLHREVVGKVTVF